MYCGSCKKQLDSKDATMNLDLLRMLVADDGKALLAEIGVERFFELEPLMDRYVEVGEVLHRVFKDSVREMPSYCKRQQLLSDFHTVAGHVGDVKLYHMARATYWWPALLDDCVKVVAYCVPCLKQKGSLS